METLASVPCRRCGSRNARIGFHVNAALEAFGATPLVNRNKRDFADSWEALDFGSPAQPARKVNPQFVSCTPPSTTIKAITGPDPVATIQAANTRAIALLDNAIKQLQSARTKIIGGAAPAAPTVSPRMAKAFRDRFKLNPADRPFWTGKGPRGVDVLIRRIRGSRQILADG